MNSYRIFLKSKLFVGVSIALFQLCVVLLSHAQVQLAPGDQDPGLPELPPILTESAEKQTGPITMPASAMSLDEDSLILVELYNNTNGAQWTTKTNWLTGPVSTWYGITVTSGRVTRVLLHNNNLSGTIPESIGNLSALTILHLYLNNLTGGIPSTLGNISTLQQLFLYDNPLGGEIPASLGDLTALNYLYIFRCNLTGQIPATLGNLTNLLRIGIHQNDLTGNLEWIGSLTNLTQLYAYGLPNLQCQIPSSVGNLTNLTHLYLYNNPKLTGTIPSSLGSCIALQHCYLHNNGLSGQLPGSLANLTNLAFFYVHFNYSITGNVPSWISGLTEMQILSLGDTDLGGSLPSNIGNLSAMTELYIQRCRISGNLPSSLQSAVDLSVVDLKFLNLTALPSFLTSLTKMKLVIANDNQLTEILDFTTHVNKANLVYNVENNKLDFGDLEPHFTGPGAHPYNTFTYSPQAEIGTVQTVYWTTGSADTLQVTTPGSLNIYQWQKKDGTDTWQDLSGQTASQLQFSNVTASDSGQYRLEITNQRATALTLYSLPFTVKVTGEVLPPDAEGQRICANQTATLTATGTGIISWFDVPAGGTSLGEGSPFVTPVLQGNKTYYVSQDVGGTVSDRRDVLVEVDSLPTVTASPDASICSGAGTTISVSGNAASYQWNNGLGQEQSYPVSPTSTTTYTVIGTGTNSCQASDDVIISVNPLPVGSISPSAIEICSGASATLTASGGVIYQWAHGPSGNIVQVSPDATTTYTVTVTGSNGCVDAAQSNVTVNAQCPAAPEELRAAALLTDQIKLTWVNKATNYTGLNLERKTTGNYALITSLEAGTTSYIDSTLQPGTLYYYRIKSFNTGNESIPSKEESEQTFSTDQHYVRNTEVLKDNVTDSSAVQTLTVGERIHSWTYLDGELRPFQQVTQQYSPSQKDAIQPHTYDPLGRTVLQFLPYSISSSAPGELRVDALATEQPQFYDGTSTPDGVPQEAVNPFTEVKYEPSPLSRVIESSATGNDWRMAAGQTIRTQYGTNVEDEVLYWTIVEDPSLSLQAPYYYAAGQLSKVTRTDMEGSVTVTYTDKLGRTVLQKSSANAGATVWASTYSIFDEHGNLAYHVTPKVVEQTEGGSWPKVVDAAMLNGLCMQYKYDNRNRIIEEKAPGAEPVYYVYDKWNRLALSQDGNQRLSNKWAFSKYDEWNRVVMTGITVNAGTVTQIRSDYDSYAQRFESRSDTTGNIHGYTNLAQPTSSTEILTVSYYDDYSSLTTQITGPEYSYKSTALTGLPADESARTLGFVTASKVKVLGTANEYLNTVSYFNDEQQIVQTVASNHLGGVDRSSTLFNFPGWVTKSNLVHFEGDTASSSMAITYFGSANNPADGGTLTLSPVAVTPPANMLAGDLVVMFACGRPQLMDLQISEAGGQSWTKVALTGTNSLSSALFWCRFNGTWSADPSVSYPGETNTTLVMHVFRPGSGSSTWSVEGTPLDQGFTAPTTPFTVNLPGATTIADSTVTLGIWFTGDDNSWGSMSGTGWVVTGLAQYRNIAGTDVSCTFAHNIKTVAGATGNVSKNQTANGGDSGDVYRFTFVETASGPTTHTEQTTITRRFDYDHTGRLLRTWHQLNSANEILLSELMYNELGQLIRKELNKEGTEKLQAVDYRHTIQGWLQGINTVPPATGDPVDYYAQEMAYNNTFNSGSLPRMDGYITATKWKNDIGNKDRLYNFEYDALGRLAGSEYKVNGGSGWSVDNGLFSENNLTYDINGNIQSLDRYTKSTSDSRVDQLAYTYGTNSNQLLSVADSATSADSFKGFTDGNTSGNDYQYDANGNLKQDLNKEIKTISYNALDLPDRIDFADSTYIQYTYDAAGVKLSQAYYGSDTLKIDYIGEFIYLNGQLQLIHTEEGRLLPPEYKNLFANKEANSLEGFEPLGDVSLATESINGQNYVRAICNQSTGTPGVWPVGGTIAVKPGEKYSFKVLGYQRHGTTASLYVWGSSGDIIWPGPVLPVGSANEDMVTAYFTVPIGVSQVKLGVRWNNPAVGDTLYINRVALYKTDWEYQYFISDHLGSPRVVLQTNPAAHTYTSTMESENLDSEEFENIETNNIVAFGSANATPGGNEVLRMNNTYRLGAARSLKVYPGDTVDASVFAYYEQDAGYSKSPNSTIIALLTSALTGGAIATTSEMVTGAYESTGNSFFALAPNQGSSKPSAFLNYILFDENFVPVEGKSAPVGDDPMIRQLITVPTITVKEVGYLYVYLSYDDESANWVFFDDLKIQHKESAVVEVNAFYPYGLTAYNWVREGEYENRFLFQGKELDSLTNWHDFHARQYDGELGRWFAVDPMGQFASQYSAMGNNPVMTVDPDGRLVWFIPVIIGAVVGGTINAVINSDNIQNPGDFFKYFGVGALAGGLAGAGGFLIAPAATATLGTGFLGGAAIGAGAGAINGLVIGAGNTWLGGGSFGEGIVNGLIGAGAGAVIGGVTGGAFSGVKSAIQGRNFWTGAPKSIAPIPSVNSSNTDLGKVRLIDDPEIQLQAPKGDLGSGSVPKSTATELPGNARLGGGDLAGKQVLTDKSPSTLGHIFTNEPGHVNPGTTTSQSRYLQLFESVTRNPTNLRVDAVQSGLITQQAANAGVQVYTQNFAQGQVWVFVRNGRIYDAGVNLLGFFR